MTLYKNTKLRVPSALLYYLLYQSLRDPVVTSFFNPDELKTELLNDLSEMLKEKKDKFTYISDNEKRLEKLLLELEDFKISMQELDNYQRLTAENPRFLSRLFSLLRGDASNRGRIN